jgi:AcrR family transcriptional regulator
MKAWNGKTGRPIGFDKDAALEAAMLLFWKRGYEGTSMADLTQAMGLNPSSIYAAFGDKHALFQLVVKRYVELRAQYAVKALEEPTLKKFIRALFDNTVAFLTAPGHPPTCMTLAGAVGCSLDATPARDLMTAIRKQNQVPLRERLLKARKSGELPKEINVDDYTRYPSRSSLVFPSKRRTVRRRRNSNGPPRWPFVIWVTETWRDRSGYFHRAAWWIAAWWHASASLAVPIGSYFF